jgi:carboxymethylenebutenolidase
VALAPDLYHGQIATEPDEARKLVMELDMAEAVKEIQRALAFLREQSYVAGPKVGIVGFCMGGGLVLQTALVEDNLSAAVAFYGRPLSAEEAPQAKAPILGQYGAADQGIPVDEVNKMDAALDEAGIENDIHVYEGAGHAFFNDTGQSYNEQAATDAWPRTLDWFRKHIGT